ncbi:unnamed protein product [Orchesella dallaii]|uniref:Uncharacterized protein n=1 Tax=Orchesella dallaii TaxID=48710 RepID=A0ABP1QWC9_9HEXA
MESDNSWGSNSSTVLSTEFTWTSDDSGDSDDGTGTYPEKKWLSLYEKMDEIREMDKHGAPEKFPPHLQKKFFGANGKKLDLARALPVPPNFENVVTISDCTIAGGLVAKTANRATLIFGALAGLLCNKMGSDDVIRNQTKLLYLRQIEQEYLAAMKKKKQKEIDKCLWLVNKTIMEQNEPWTKQDWILASKAYFCPIHVLHHCPRIPYNPHVHRYAFSPVVESEPPLRLVIDNSEFDFKI